MKKQQELFNQNSCLNKAEDDEPIFVLRANDELAPIVVRLWAGAYLEMKTRKDRATPQQIDKYLEAMTCARAMEEWRKGREKETQEAQGDEE